MALKNDKASLYVAQEADLAPLRALNAQIRGGSDYAMGKAYALYSELAAFAAGGQDGDLIYYFKLPPGTWIIGGWFYAEDGLTANASHIDLGVIYEDADGVDDVDALIDGMDAYDGTDCAAHPVLPTGGMHIIPQDVAAAPYLVTGGWGTVVGYSDGAALVTSKDTKLVLFVILPA